MTEDELDTLNDEFKVLLAQMENLGKVEGVDSYEPMTFPFDVSIDAMREDVPEKPLSREEALKNAGRTKDGQIMLPKVVG